MNTKTILIIVGVVVVAALGYFAFTQNNAESVPASEQTPAGVGAPQGKLDSNAVCQGALAYMSFPDGASAEAFVAECKEGKHPEVIEKYKADMNLGAGAQI